ncbi:hypothetical protein FHG87_017793 [Trinorchestia longiramus]|nr:hypothetical protein FHG87_017793 [Trinorchestia longiramus]
MEKNSNGRRTHISVVDSSCCESDDSFLVTIFQNTRKDVLSRPLSVGDIVLMKNVQCNNFKNSLRGSVRFVGISRCENVIIESTQIDDSYVNPHPHPDTIELRDRLQKLCEWWHENKEIFLEYCDTNALMRLALPAVPFPYPCYEPGPDKTLSECCGPTICNIYCEVVHSIDLTCCALVAFCVRDGTVLSVESVLPPITEVTDVIVNAKVSSWDRDDLKLVLQENIYEHSMCNGILVLLGPKLYCIARQIQIGSYVLLRHVTVTQESEGGPVCLSMLNNNHCSVIITGNGHPQRQKLCKRLANVQENCRDRGLSGAGTSGGASVQPSATPAEALVQPSATPAGASVQPSATPGAVQPSATSEGASVQPSSTPAAIQPSSTSGGASVLPSATSGRASVQPSATSGGASVQPSATSGGASVQSSATPGRASVQPSATSGGASVQPSATSGGASVQPSATSGGASVQPSCTPEASGQPADTSGGASGQPAGTSGGASGQPAGTSGGASGQPAGTSGASCQPAGTSGASCQPAGTSGGPSCQPAGSSGTSGQPAGTSGGAYLNKSNSPMVTHDAVHFDNHNLNVSSLPPNYFGSDRSRNVSSPEKQLPVVSIDAMHRNLGNPASCRVESLSEKIKFPSSGKDFHGKRKFPPIRHSLRKRKASSSDLDSDECLQSSSSLERHGFTEPLASEENEDCSRARKSSDDKNGPGNTRGLKRSGNSKENNSTCVINPQQSSRATPNSAALPAHNPTGVRLKKRRIGVDKKIILRVLSDASSVSELGSRVRTRRAKVNLAQTSQPISPALNILSELDDISEESPHSADVRLLDMVIGPPIQMPQNRIKNPSTNSVTQKNLDPEVSAARSGTSSKLSTSRNESQQEEQHTENSRLPFRGTGDLDDSRVSSNCKTRSSGLSKDTTSVKHALVEKDVSPSNRSKLPMVQLTRVDSEDSSIYFTPSENLDLGSFISQGKFNAAKRRKVSSSKPESASFVTPSGKTSLSGRESHGSSCTTGGPSTRSSRKTESLPSVSEIPDDDSSDVCSDCCTFDTPVQSTSNEQISVVPLRSSDSHAITRKSRTRKVDTSSSCSSAREQAPHSIFNVPASCLPSPKLTPRPAKVEDQQLRYFLQKDKITSFDAFKPERNLQKQYKNLIISRSKERLVCLFMTDNFSECSQCVIVENKPTLCSPLTLSAFKNGIKVPLFKTLHPNNGLRSYTQFDETVRLAMHYDIPFDKTIQTVVTLLQAHTSACVDTEKEKKLLRDFLVLPCKRKLQYIISSIDKDQVLRETFNKVQTLQQKNVFLLVDEVRIRPTVSFSDGALSGIAENNRDCKATSILCVMMMTLHKRPS